MTLLEQLIAYDKELFMFLNHLGNERWDGFWMFVTNKVNWIPLYVVLLVLVYREYGPKRTVAILVTVAIMVLVTDQLANFFKYGVQRLRPCYDAELGSMVRLVKNSCGGKFGYFSAHAANHMAVAFFFTSLLGSKLRYIGIFLVFWAFLVAYSRIYIGVHFPLDVLSGLGIGLFLSWLFAKLFIFALHRFPI